MAAAFNHDGICHAVAINTTEDDIDIEVSPQKIIPFDFQGFPGKGFFDSELECYTKGSQGWLIFHTERVKESLYITYLNEAE